jgi:hypothetical protein
VEGTPTNERDENGKIMFYQGIVVGITDRKRAEEKLSRSAAKFRRILATWVDPCLMILAPPIASRRLSAGKPSDLQTPSWMPFTVNSTPSAAGTNPKTTSPL